MKVIDRVIIGDLETIVVPVPEITVASDRMFRSRPTSRDQNGDPDKDSYHSQAQSKIYSNEFSPEPDYRKQNSSTHESSSKSREYSHRLNYRSQYSPKRTSQESSSQYHGQFSPKRTSQSYRSPPCREEGIHYYQCGSEGHFVRDCQEKNVLNAESIIGMWPPFVGEPCIVPGVLGPALIAVETQPNFR